MKALYVIPVISLALWGLAAYVLLKGLKWTP